MSGFLTSLFDPYDRKARLGPVVFCGLPLTTSIVLLIPEVSLIWSGVGGLVLYGGGVMFLTQIGRDRGKALEPALFESWGGKPSVAMMRYSDSRLTNLTKERYRCFLVRAVQGLTLLSPEDEQKYPDKADDGYESATAWLLTKTRDRERFALLFRENINYGFRRNIWALKPWAFVLDAIAIAMLALVAFGSWTGDVSTTIEVIRVDWWASLFLTIVHMLSFAIKLKKEWVRTAAEAYAQQLLAACDAFESVSSG